MKFSEKWLREWVNPKLKREAFGEALTMAGFEVEEMMPVATNVANVIVAEVLTVVPHPDADRLSVCEVKINNKKTLTIVCGAPNVKSGIKVPLAQTPPKKIRGVESQGMLCSAAELGLSENNNGLFLLNEDAKVGESLKNYLGLDDYSIVVAIMPDRGDCLSIKGLSREVAAITKTSRKELLIKPVKARIKDKIKVKITDKRGCPHYIGRVIRNVNAKAESPIWLKERLRRAGTRNINAVVDVTNYVMLELGQPMHAFDLSKIDTEIEVRLAKAGEKLQLLDESEKELTATTMVIADKHQPLAIAGVMGGLASGVTDQTTDIFLESAFFNPEVIAAQRQYYNLNSDSAYRFERGVDPTLQNQAIERATQLILDIAGGEAGPIVETTITKTLPRRPQVSVTAKKIEQVLGLKISPKYISEIFKSLEFKFKISKDKWTVQVPPFRFDISLPEDLIEEIARLYGLDKIPERKLQAELGEASYSEEQDYQPIRDTLRHLGYHEIVSYSFVDKDLQNLLDPHQKPQALINPISHDMAVMRTNLWPGLLQALRYNQARQQDRVRLFEIGTVFLTKANSLQQVSHLAGIVSGDAFAQQWGHPARKVDFFDVKGDLESLLKPYVTAGDLSFVKSNHPVLHPGQSAVITYKSREIGILGALNPNVLQRLDLVGPIYFFEFHLQSLRTHEIGEITEVSKFPEIRRDLAILVNEAVPSKEIQDTIRKVAGDWLKEVFIFDVYNGKGISPGHKSIALGLVIQHPTRTLVDKEVTELMERVVTTLKGKLGAQLRS